MGSARAKQPEQDMTKRKPRGTEHNTEKNKREKRLKDTDSTNPTSQNKSPFFHIPPSILHV